MNFFTGKNGSGKTNIIEAVSIVSNLKSFNHYFNLNNHEKKSIHPRRGRDGRFQPLAGGIAAAGVVEAAVGADGREGEGRSL